MSLGSLYTKYSPVQFPIGPIIVAPYWTDIDLSNGEGSVNYTVLLQSNGSSYIDVVDRFLEEKGIIINSTMILVAQWLNVCHYPAEAGCSALVSIAASLLEFTIMVLGKLVSTSDSY